MILRKIQKSVETKDFPVLPLEQCLAKTIKIKENNLIVSKPGINVFLHCFITGLVAEELLNRLPDWLRKKFPKNSSFVSATHDVGKVSPNFQQNIYNKGLNQILELLFGYDDLTKISHALISQVTISEKNKYLQEIVGRHHGFSQIIDNIGLNKVGGEKWQNLRLSLIEKLKENLQQDWPEIQNEIEANLITGLTCVSDWISSSIFSNGEEVKTEKQQLINIVKTSIDSSGFIPPKIKKKLTFQDIFNDFKPKHLQTKFFEIVESQGVYVLEAPMGFGKTEAALYAAYKILEKNLATGIYFALPTQLTSDKIHERMNLFLKKILENDSENSSSLLLHGNAWLQETNLEGDASPGKSWFNSSKRAILAPFGVGTIDQALMSVMNVKHGFVREFGLMGKVVILDEIHSYDMYTGTIIDELIENLQQIGCTVIILSATLTFSKRNKILKIEDSKPSLNLHYPLISFKSEGKTSFINFKTNPEEEKKVSVRFESEQRAIFEALKRAQEGQQVLWIENTVSMSQHIYELFSFYNKSQKIEIGLLHSRFLKVDRQKIEDKWVNVLGKNNKESRLKNGRVLIGTQILEQSLDIDADFLVTRLCPIDMFFQRLGRLWRHKENNEFRKKFKISNGNAEVIIISPSFEVTLINEKAFSKEEYVYDEYCLIRTLEILQNKTEVYLPKDIPVFLEEVYKERDEENKILVKFKSNVLKNSELLKMQASSVISKGGRTLNEENVSTRNIEYDTVNLLIIKKLIKIDNNKTKIVFLDNQEEIIDKTCLDKMKIKKITIKLLKNCVHITPNNLPNSNLEDIEFLRDYLYISDKNNENIYFSIAIKNDDNSLENLKGEKKFKDLKSKSFTSSYNSITGYKIKKQKKW